MKLEQILFLDIETVPLEASFEELSEEAQQLFAEKTRYQRKEETSPKNFTLVRVFGLNLGKLCVYQRVILSMFLTNDLFG
jgi:hypothetical protein